MRVIYIDVLFLLNFYITYFLIIGTGCITHKKISLKRRILGSAAGGIGSFVILLPAVPVILSLLGKLFICLIIALIAFGFSDFGSFLKSAFIFFGVNCIYAGIMLMLWLFAAPSEMMYNNGTSYFQAPVWGIAAFTSIAYLVLKLVARIMNKGADFDRKYSIRITTEKGYVTLNGIADSGNKLVDFFSGLPVIFCDFDKCRSVCPDEVIFQLNSGELSSDLIHGVRIVPCSTVAGAGTAICFKPSSISISWGDNEKKDIDALIGFTENGLNSTEFEAIFNPNIL